MPATLSRVGDERAHGKARKRLRKTLSGSDWGRLRRDGRPRSALAKMGLLAADRAAGAVASTTKAIDNLVRAIEQGLPFTDSVSTRLSENEERKRALAEAIEAEEARSRVAKDETSIRAFFEKYASADFEDPATRDTLLEYFIDRIYLYDDGHFVITGWYWGDECHKLPEGEVEGLQARSSAFEYVVDFPPGFDYFADGGTITNELPTTGSFFVWSTGLESNP